MKKIYFHQDGNHVEKYEMDTVQLYERLHLLEKGELPHGLRLLERAPYEQPDNTSIDADLLIRKLTEMNHKQGLLPDYEVKLYDIIKDVEIAQEINDKGYAIIDFLTEKEREEMGEWFSQYSLDISKSQDAFAIKQTKEIHQKIQEVIQYRIEHFFKDAYSPYSYLYSNESKAKKHVDWQRDPSIILNEQLEPLYGIRCNLTNKGEEVRLKVVPGSHRLLKRLNFVPAVLESPLTEYLRVFDQYEVLISLKVGQALLYDMRLIHSTISNASEVDADYLFMQIAHRDIQDFFNVKIKEGEERKGLVFRLTNDCFFNENREGDIEGPMHFFDYLISESDIHEYLKRFVKK